MYYHTIFMGFHQFFTGTVFLIFINFFLLLFPKKGDDFCIAGLSENILYFIYGCS